MVVEYLLLANVSEAMDNLIRGRQLRLEAEPLGAATMSRQAATSS